MSNNRKNSNRKPATTKPNSAQINASATRHKRKKKLLSTFEWLLLFVALLIIAFVFFQKNGMQLIRKTEKIEIVKPSK